jgi:lichenan operon transcriptional antiterminator
MATESYLTGRYLANINQVTSRTVRNDKKQLDKLLSNHGAYIESIPGKGYKLHVVVEKKFKDFIVEFIKKEEVICEVPNFPEERINYLIKRLLLSDSYLKLDDLAEELYVSKSTLQNDLQHVKKQLARYNLYLETKPSYGMKVSGEELKIRFCIAEHVFNQNFGLHCYTWYPKFTKLTQEELKGILDIIIKQIKAYEITLSDIAIDNLLIHIAIAYERIKIGFNVNMIKTDVQEIMKKREYQVAKQIVTEIEKTFHVKFPTEETAYITIHLLGTNNFSYKDTSEMLLTDVIDKDILSIVMKSLSKVEKELKLGIKNDLQLRAALCLHLKPAINRYRYGMNIRNPMLDDIKKNYPLAFEAAIIAGISIEQITGIKIDKNEVGYLALHIGAAIENQRLKTASKRCLVICASGFGTSKLIYYRLKSQFGEHLSVVGTTEYYKLKQYDLSDIDFIVSSIPIKDVLPVPVIEVNAILGNQDIRAIRRYVYHDQLNKNIFFTEDLTFLQQEFSSKKQVLEYLCNILYERNLIDYTFLPAIYEREKIAPTAFGNLVAIPHPIVPKSRKTFLTVCTLKKPILWADKQVQFICLISIKKNTEEDLQPMYELISEIIDNNCLVQHLIKASTYHDFVKQLSKCGINFISCRNHC